MAQAKGIPAIGSLHRACSQFDEAQLASCESSTDQALPRGYPRHPVSEPAAKLLSAGAILWYKRAGNGVNYGAEPDVG